MSERTYLSLSSRPKVAETSADGHVQSAISLPLLLRDHLRSIRDSTCDDANMEALGAKLFSYLRAEAEAMEASPLTSLLARTFVLAHDSLHKAIGTVLADKLCDSGVFGSASASDRKAQQAAFRCPRSANRTPAASEDPGYNC
jgi:hypothetical protein